MTHTETRKNVLVGFLVGVILLVALLYMPGIREHRDEWATSIRPFLLYILGAAAVLVALAVFKNRRK